MNAITLRSGRESKSPQMPMREDRREVNNEKDVGKEVPIETPSERVHTEGTKEVQAKHILPPMKP